MSGEATLDDPSLCYQDPGRLTDKLENTHCPRGLIVGSYTCEGVSSVAMEEQRDSPGCTMYDIGHAHFLLAHTVGVFGGYRRTAGCHLQHRFRPGASSAASSDSESALHFHPAGNHR